VAKCFTDVVSCGSVQAQAASLAEKSLQKLGSQDRTRIMTIDRWNYVIHRIVVAMSFDESVKSILDLLH
jgi:hypothetical protein